VTLVADGLGARMPALELPPRGIYVILCRNCAEVGGGEHYHRACQGRGRRWVEQARELPREPER
jgi:hypothetical protein